MKEFKTNLKNYRVENGYTQESLAKLLHVSRSAVAKWENGLGLPTKESIDDICKLFNITEDELFETEDSNQLILEKNKKIVKYKNHRNIVLISLLIFILVTIVSLIIHSTNIKPKYYYNESVVNVNLNKETTVLEHYECIDVKDGYVYTRIEIHSIDFTSNSKLYGVIIDTTFVPGSVAYRNDLKGYNKNSTLGYGKVTMDIDNNTMDYKYSYPNNYDDIHFLKPSYGGEITINESQFCGINIYNINKETCKLEYIKQDDGLYSPLISTLLVENKKITHTQTPKEEYTGLSMGMRTVYLFEKRDIASLGPDITFSVEYEMNIDNKYYIQKVNYNCNY